MKFGKDCEILWQDRKHHMGMPISVTRYYLVRKPGEWVKLFSHEGFFSALVDEVNIYRCLDVQLNLSFFDKLFKTGTLVIRANDDTSPIIKIKNIKEPYKIRDMFSSLIESERKAKGVGVREFQ